MIPPLVAETFELHPFPGLRSFRESEAHLFFGRDGQSNEIVRQCEKSRFVAVVGASGCGKSSLVRAGLLPTLYAGYFAAAGSKWQVAGLRPGSDPIGNLWLALKGVGIGDDAERDLLRSSSSAVTGVMFRARQRNQIAPNENLLILVDQFEELFRFPARKESATADRDEKALFVSLLLEATRQRDERIYVVFTLRADFLGDCTQFRDLPEAINREQYLVPRMTREQIRDAIEKPLRLVGARMSARLVERLLNELGDDTGQLPVLQHALRRTFHEFEKRGGQGEIGADDYVAAGQMQGALNAHANAILNELGNVTQASGLSSAVDDSKPWTEKVFRCLTTVENGRKIRRPTRLDRIYAVVGASDDESKAQVRHVIEAYSGPDEAMLVWSRGDDADDTVPGKLSQDSDIEKLPDDCVIDISHESLIEHWTLLKDWVNAEADAARLYHAALDDAVRSLRGGGGKWRTQKLSEAITYIQQGQWNEAWAERLGDHRVPFTMVKSFLDREAADEREEDKQKDAEHARELRAERQKRRYVVFVGLLVLLLVLLALVLVFLYQRSLTARAESEKARAQSERALAESEKKRLDLENSEAVLRQQIASSDDILNQYANQVRYLRSQIDHAAPGEKQKFQAMLKELQDKESQMRKQRDSAAARLSANLKNRRVNSVDGLTYVFIPPGNFMMGCSPGDTECSDNENPPHAEQIASGFWLGQTEVTQHAWKKVISNKNPSHFDGDQLPVERVDWTQAQNYCKAVGGRLPTEKEWEYAARAGKTDARYGALDAIAWYSGNSAGTTHPVGLKPSNAFGLYDMLGNVWEWTADSYAGTKVVRGGAWFALPKSVRASYHMRLGLAYRSNTVGFRCVGEFR